MASAEAQAVLRSLALFLHCDIAEIEATHSSNREATMLRTRGWFTSLETLSAKFVTKVVGKFTGTLGAGKKPDKTDQKESSCKPKIVRGGGAWRAFCHEKFRGVKFDKDTISAIAEEYRRLTPEEKQRYDLAGLAAVRAKRSGFSSFPRHSSVDSGAEPALFEHIDDIPGPGETTESGAIVAADSDFNLALLTTYRGNGYFNEKYQHVKQLAHRERKLRKDYELDLCAEEVEEFASLEESTRSSAHLPQQAAANGHQQMSNGFKVRSFFTTCETTFVGVEWFPPVARATKAGMFRWDWSLLAGWLLLIG